MNRPSFFYLVRLKPKDKTTLAEMTDVGMKELLKDGVAKLQRVAFKTRAEAVEALKEINGSE
jgi:hypothetical protein